MFTMSIEMTNEHVKKVFDIVQPSDKRKFKMPRYGTSGPLKWAKL